MKNSKQHAEEDVQVENFGSEDGSWPGLASEVEHWPDDDSPPQRVLIETERIKLATGTIKVALAGLFALAILVVVVDPSMVEPVWERVADIVGWVLAAVIGYCFRGHT